MEACEAIPNGLADTKSVRHWRELGHCEYRKVSDTLMHIRRLRGRSTIHAGTLLRDAHLPVMLRSPFHHYSPSVDSYVRMQPLKST
jgi:hypothetical protein